MAAITQVRILVTATVVASDKLRSFGKDLSAMAEVTKQTCQLLLFDSTPCRSHFVADDLELVKACRGKSLKGTDQDTVTAW